MPSELIGYTDRISVTPGEAIAFKVSTDFEQYDGAIVRLIHGDANGPGFIRSSACRVGHHGNRPAPAVMYAACDCTPARTGGRHDRDGRSVAPASVTRGRVPRF